MHYTHSKTHMCCISVTIVEYSYSHKFISDKSCKMTYNKITFKTIHLIVDAPTQATIHTFSEWRLCARMRHII
jgi:hypothetical protein